MKISFEQFIEASKKIGLTSKEKGAISESLLKFTLDNPPLQNPAPVRETYGPRPLLQRSLISIKSLLTIKYMPILIAIALIFATGGGVSYAAQGSLPGDALYPVKVNINEAVAEALTFSAEGKAKLNADLAGERLSEFEKLSVKGTVDPNVTAEVKAKFSDRAEKLKELIKELDLKNDHKDAAEIDSEFETSLKAHEAILVQLSKDQKDDSEQINAVTPKVAEEAKAAESARVESESKLAGEPADEVKEAAKEQIEHANEKISEVTEMLTENEGKFTLQDVTDAKAQLKVASDTAVQAQAKFDAGAYADAFVLAQKAIRTAEDAKLILKAQSDLKIDVKVKEDQGENENDQNKNEDRAKQGKKDEGTGKPETKDSKEVQENEQKPSELKTEINANVGAEKSGDSANLNANTSVRLKISD